MSSQRPRSHLPPAAQADPAPGALAQAASAQALGSASLARVDLNLFRVLDAVHEHGGISGAARHLHLSQPAVSHALARLRRIWGDPLFVRHGNRMVPTELTRRIMGEVQTHLRGLGALLSQAQGFEPQRLNMTVRLGMRDVLEAITLPPLVATLAHAAPGVQVTSLRVPHDQMERALTQGEVDLVIDRQRRLPTRIQGQHLADESLTVVMREGHPCAAQPLALADYFAQQHIMVSMRADQPDPLQSLWAAKGLGPRRISLRCQHYFAAANVVIASDALLTLPRTYAQRLISALPLVVCDAPMELPTMGIWMYWDLERDGDPVHGWLRQQVAQGATMAMRGVHDLR